MAFVLVSFVVGFLLGRLRYSYYVKEPDRIAGPYSYYSATRYCDFLRKDMNKDAKVVRIWRIT